MEQVGHDRTDESERAKIVNGPDQVDAAELDSASAARDGTEAATSWKPRCVRTGAT